MKDKRDIILEFSGQVQRILGDSLIKVIYMVLLPAEIIQIIQILI